MTQPYEQLQPVPQATFDTLMQIHAYLSGVTNPTERITRLKEHIETQLEVVITAIQVQLVRGPAE